MWRLEPTAFLFSIFSWTNNRREFPPPSYCRFFDSWQPGEPLPLFGWLFCRAISDDVLHSMTSFKLLYCQTWHGTWSSLYIVGSTKVHWTQSQSIVSYPQRRVKRIHLLLGFLFFLPLNHKSPDPKPSTKCAPKKKSEANKLFHQVSIRIDSILKK